MARISELLQFGSAEAAHGKYFTQAHKGQVGADIYIEDSPEHVENLRKDGFHVICFANPTNKGISAPRAESWEQVYELVKARAAELEAKERG